LLHEKLPIRSTAEEARQKELRPVILYEYMDAPRAPAAVRRFFPGGEEQLAVSSLANCNLS
jgi:hypothetical protein